MIQAKINEKTEFKIEIEEKKQKATHKTNKKKDNNSLGILNPRYFEEEMTPKQARDLLPLKIIDFCQF